MTERRARVADSSSYASAVVEVTSLPIAVVCVSFLRVAPVARAAMSLLGDPFGIETVSASDADAARFDEAQIDLGEGPGWDAMRASRPVFESDLVGNGPSIWPLWTETVLAAGLRAVFAFPLRAGPLRLGAVQLYAEEERELTPEQIDGVSSLADLAATRLLRIAMSDIDRQQLAPPATGYSRREMHQATGMVSVQLGVTVEDALLVIRAQAYVQGRPVREVAADIVARRVKLEPE